MRPVVVVLLLIWALAVACMSVLGVRGNYTTTSVNGMRRRRSNESKRAWRAGLRALFPWEMTSAAVLGALAIVIWLSAQELMYPLLGAGILLAFSLVLTGVRAMNRAIRRCQLE